MAGSGQTLVTVSWDLPPTDNVRPAVHFFMGFSPHLMAWGSKGLVGTLPSHQGFSACHALCCVRLHYPVCLPRREPPSWWGPQALSPCCMWYKESWAEDRFCFL